MMTKRALWALPILLGLAGCGGGSNGPTTEARGPAPSASELGGHLAYSQSDASFDGSYNIYVARANGGDAQRLTDNRVGGNANAALSPDGKRVAFTNFYRSENVVGQAIDGSEFYSFGSGTSPAWSADNTNLAFASARTGQSQIYLTRAQTGNEPEPQLFAGEGAYNFAPTFSPDGATLAYVSTRTFMGEGDARTDAFRLILAPVVGGTSRTAVSSASALDAPTFAPDGKHLAYLSNNAIYTVNADGTGRRLIPTEAGEKRRVTYSPDSRFLAYDNGDIATSNIYITRADGSSQSRLFAPREGLGSQVEPSWSR